MLILTIDEHVILKDPVEADVLKAVEVPGHFQFFLPGCAQTFIRTPGTHYLAPEMNERLTLSFGIRR
jgi:hypothetical protein